MQCNNVLTIRLDEKSFVFPQFCSSTTLPVRTIEPDWKRPEEIMEYLKDKNITVRSKVSLFNYETPMTFSKPSTRMKMDNP